MRAVARPLAMLTLVEMGGAAGLFTVPVLAPAAAADLAIDPNWIGVFTGLAFMSAMIGSAMSAGLIDRYGPIRVSQFALVLMAASYVVLPVAWVPAFALGGLCIGMAYGHLPGAASQVLARVSTGRAMGFVFSIKQTGNPVGGVAIGVAVPALVVAFGWRIACVAVVVVCLVLAASIQGLRAEFDADRRPDRRLTVGSLAEPWRLVLGSPRLRPFGVAGVPFTALQTCITSYLVVYLVEDLSYDLVTAGIALSIAQGAGMACRLGLGALSGTIIDGRRLFGLTGLVMSVAAASLAFVEPNWPLAMVLTLSGLLGGSGMGWGGLFMGELARRAPPGEAGRSTGGGSSLGFAGGALGPVILSALVWATGSYGASFFVMALVTLGPALVLSRPAPRP